MPKTGRRGAGREGRNLHRKRASHYLEQDRERCLESAAAERGNSTPIVWQDRVFVTQALEKEGRRTLMCFDRQDGRLLWQEGTEWREPEATHARTRCAPRRPSRTANGSWRGSVRPACSATTSKASCCGSATSACSAHLGLRIVASAARRIVLPALRPGERSF